MTIEGDLLAREVRYGISWCWWRYWWRRERDDDSWWTTENVLRRETSTSVLSPRKSPPRVESTQPMDTSPEPSSSRLSYPAANSRWWRWCYDERRAGAEERRRTMMPIVWMKIKEPISDIIESVVCEDGGEEEKVVGDCWAALTHATHGETAR
ncbi:hypothetical protein JOM56_007897 [Amanita muscaria]